MRQKTRFPAGAARGRTWLILVVLGAALLGKAAEARAERPSLWSACAAWNNHIGDLIDEHRTAHELDDDRFGEIMRLFYDAQTACTAMQFEQGLAIYGAIPIERVKQRPLR